MEKGGKKKSFHGPGLGIRTRQGPLLCPLFYGPANKKDEKRNRCLILFGNNAIFLYMESKININIYYISGFCRREGIPGHYLAERFSPSYKHNGIDIFRMMFSGSFYFRGLLYIESCVVFYFFSGAKLNMSDFGVLYLRKFSSRGLGV